MEILRQGSSGKNVEFLQNLLNKKLIPSPNLKIDGIFEPKTYEAVIRFQKSKGLMADGIVGPKTWALLTGKKVDTTVVSLKTEPVDTLLPKEGLGYKTYSREDGRWGTVSTINALKDIAKMWHTKHPDTPIYIGDISRKGGGDFPPHKSHKTGIDVDIRPFRSDNKDLPVTWRDKAYDQKKTKELIELIRSSYRTKLILFNDPKLIEKGLCTSWANHDNHLHIRFDFEAK